MKKDTTIASSVSSKQEESSSFFFIFPYIKNYFVLRQQSLCMAAIALSECVNADQELGRTLVQVGFCKCTCSTIYTLKSYFPSPYQYWQIWSPIINFTALLWSSLSKLKSCFGVPSTWKCVHPKNLLNIVMHAMKPSITLLYIEGQVREIGGEKRFYEEGQMQLYQDWDLGFEAPFQCNLFGLKSLLKKQYKTRQSTAKVNLVLQNAVCLPNSLGCYVTTTWFCVPPASGSQHITTCARAKM